MIINFYLPDQDVRLLDQVRSISEENQRSVSYIIREALASYVLGATRRHAKTHSPRRKRGESQTVKRKG